jgi:hypothetical protein
MRMSRSQQFRKMAADLLRQSRRKDSPPHEREADRQLAEAYRRLAAAHARLAGEKQRAEPRRKFGR